MIHQASTATLRPDLQVAVHEFDIEKASKKLIGRRVLPVFRSAADSGEYAVFTRENLQRTPDAARAGDGSYNRISSVLGSKTFQTEDNGLEFLLDDAKARKYARYLDYEGAMTKTIWYQLMIGLERRAQAIADAASATAAATAWSTIADADIIGDVDGRATVIEDACGASPEDLSLVVSATDFRYMTENAALLDRIKYTLAAVADLRQSAQAQLLAPALGLREILVGRAAYNAVPEGGTVAMTKIWAAGKAFLALLGEGEGQPLETPCLGRIILWTEDSPELPTMETYYSDERRGNVIRGRNHTDEIAQASNIDYFCQEITTTG